MPQDVGQIRQNQGRFQQQMAQDIAHLPRYGPGRSPRLAGYSPLSIRNRADCLVALLALSAVVRLPPALPGARPPPVETDSRAGAHALRPAYRDAPLHSGFLPGAHATGDAAYQPLTAEAAVRNLQSITNGVVGTCVARPAHCSRALLAGGLGAMASAVMGFVAGRASAPGCTDTAAPAAGLPLDGNTLLEELPSAERREVLDILQRCGDEPECAVPEIRVVLDQLPLPLQQRLLSLLRDPAAEDAAVASWFPSAEALAVPPGGSWMDHIAQVLGTQITAEEATLELDIDALVNATLASQRPIDRFAVRQRLANEARRQTITRLFEAAGFTVESRPFKVTVRSLFGFTTLAGGENLMVTLCGPGETARTLMVMAHGDMAAAEIGSTGALDNGAGLAALLALARRLHATGLPAGTCVQLLVTDREELGLHGAKAHAETCLETNSCPDAALNVDLVFDGDGLTLSGSGDHGFYRDGDSRPRGADATPVTAAEDRLDTALREAARALGMQVHPTPNWTLASDHIAFQRKGIPAIGVSLMDTADIAPERAVQQAQDDFLRAEEAVDWSQYEAYLADALNATDAAHLEQTIAVAEDAAAAYRALPLSRRERLIHSAADQPWHVDPRRTIAAVRVLERAIRGWLAAPAAHLGA